MSLLTGVSSFFGLDIGTTAIRVVQLRGGGPLKSLVRYAYVPVDSKIVLSDSKTDQQHLAQVIKELLDQAHMGTRNVAVGVPSQRVFTAVVDFDRLPANELAKAIRYQADSLIPTPLEKSKIDWAIIGDSPKDKTKVEVLLSSVENDFVEQRLDLFHDFTWSWIPKTIRINDFSIININTELTKTALYNFYLRRSNRGVSCKR